MQMRSLVWFIAIVALAAAIVLVVVAHGGGGLDGWLPRIPGH